MRYQSGGGWNVLIALFLFLFFGFGCTQKLSAQSEKAVKGQIDLRGVDFNANTSIPLRGEWEFYWEHFITSGDFHVVSSIHYVKVPSSWNGEEIKGEKVNADGYATYRLKVLLTDTLRSMALKLNVISTAYSLYVNGERLLTVGHPGITKEETDPSYMPSTVYFTPTAATEIVLHVANFDHRLGGLRNTIYIGNPVFVAQSREKSLLTALFIAGCFFMMGLYHLVLYVINRDNSPLFFSLFCFFLTLRVMVTGDIPITSYITPNWQVLIKMEYLTFYLSGIVFLKFFSSLFRKFRIPLIENICYVFVGTMSLIVLIAPPIFFTKLLITTQSVIILLMGYTFYILYKEYKIGNREAIIFFFGYVFFITSIVNDILFVDEFIETGHLFFVGLFVFMGSQAALLSLRYSSAFATNMKLLGQLNVANQELETKVLERTEVLNEQKESLETSNVKITHQNDELVKLNQELDSFVYSVSHDLKAPIASMLGLLYLSKGEEDMPTLRDYMKMMERSLHKQGEFIGDILDYSRNARLTLLKNKIDFESVVDRVLEQYEFIEEWHMIEKVVKVDQVQDFISDQQRLAIILNNLISNALKYSTESSSKPKVEINVRATATEACIEVIDNGCGIDPSHHDKLFDMFYRADDRKHGSGLGLYIVKETIDKLNGTVTLESKVRIGTKLTVIIPNLQSNSNE